MIIDKDVSGFSQSLHTKLSKIWSPNFCRKQVEKYENSPCEQAINSISDALIADYAKDIVNGELDRFLKEHFQGDYRIYWATFDSVDSNAPQYYQSTKWHLDSGIRGTLKLFIYLNAVKQHGGNTLILDRDKTELLRRAGYLPLAQEERREDLNPALRALGLGEETITYGLEAGDGFLFSPLLLAHRCLPPQVGKVRHTFSFTLAPI